MSDNTKQFGAFMLLLTIILSIASGVLAWSWIEPESFLGAIGFLILWAILSKVGHFIAMAIIYLLFDR